VPPTTSSQWNSGKPVPAIWVVVGDEPAFPVDVGCVIGVVELVSGGLAAAPHELDLDEVSLGDDPPSTGIGFPTGIEAQCVVASNGHQALRMAQEHAGDGISLLLTDVGMPFIGGVELAA